MAAEAVDTGPRAPSPWARSAAPLGLPHGRRGPLDAPCSLAMGALAGAALTAFGDALRPSRLARLHRLRLAGVALMSIQEDSPLEGALFLAAS